MGFELELKNVVFVDAVSFSGDTHTVTQQREAGQGVVILKGQEHKVGGELGCRPAPSRGGAGCSVPPPSPSLRATGFL